MRALGKRELLYSRMELVYGESNSVEEVCIA